MVTEMKDICYKCGKVEEIYHRGNFKLYFIGNGGKFSLKLEWSGLLCIKCAEQLSETVCKKWNNENKR